MKHQHSSFVSRNIRLINALLSAAFFSLLMIASQFAFSQAAPAGMVVDVAKPVAEIQPTMWGIFFEDINFGADGGLYAELVKNRSFEFDVPLMGWTEQNKGKFSINRESGSILIMNGLKASNPRFARVTVNADKGYGITNDGFRGMGIKKDLQYNFSVWASQATGDALKMRVELVDPAGKVLGEATVTPSGKEWKKYEASLTANGTEPKAKLNIWFEGKGTVDLDMVSLFPSDTWKKRANGLRADLVQLLADMKPGFLRFPGGCIVEGRDLDASISMEKDSRSIGESRADDQPLEYRIRTSPCTRLLSIFRFGILRIFPTR